MLGVVGWVMIGAAIGLSRGAAARILADQRRRLRCAVGRARRPAVRFRLAVSHGLTRSSRTNGIILSRTTIGQSCSPEPRSGGRSRNPVSAPSVGPSPRSVARPIRSRPSRLASPKSWRAEHSCLRRHSGLSRASSRLQGGERNPDDDAGHGSAGLVVGPRGPVLRAVASRGASPRGP